LSDREVHPQTLPCCAPAPSRWGWILIIGDPLTISIKAVFGGLLAYPGSSGIVRDLRPGDRLLRAKGGLPMSPRICWR